jgi:hypothetical protein
MGNGQREKSLSNPMAPRRLAGFGVSTMLFLPSRMGRTSTAPPRDKPEASRHHFGSVARPTVETVTLSKSFMFYGAVLGNSGFPERPKISVIQEKSQR